MQTVTLRSYVGEDGVLRLDVPTDLKNTDLEVVLVLHPIHHPDTTQPTKPVAQAAWEKIEQARQRYAAKTFSNSAELLREDRQR